MRAIATILMVCAILLGGNMAKPKINAVKPVPGSRARVTPVLPPVAPGKRPNPAAGDANFGGAGGDSFIFLGLGLSRREPGGNPDAATPARTVPRKP